MGGITGLNQAPVTPTLAKFLSLYRQQGRVESSSTLQIQVLCQQTESLPYIQTTKAGYLDLRITDNTGDHPAREFYLPLDFTGH